MHLKLKNKKTVRVVIESLKEYLCHHPANSIITVLCIQVALMPSGIKRHQVQYTPLYEKGIKKAQIKSMETTNSKKAPKIIKAIFTVNIGTRSAWSVNQNFS